MGLFCWLRSWLGIVESDPLNTMGRAPLPFARLGTLNY